MNRIYVLFIRAHIFLSLEPPHTENLILTDIRSQHKYFGANGCPHLIIPLKSKFQKTWSSQWPLVRWVVSKLLLWCALGKQDCPDSGRGWGGVGGWGLLAWRGFGLLHYLTFPLLIPHCWLAVNCFVGCRRRDLYTRRRVHCALLT